VVVVLGAQTVVDSAPVKLRAEVASRKHSVVLMDVEVSL
jgi:hypothetical protein